jgi:hypothetical protein
MSTMHEKCLWKMRYTTIFSRGGLCCLLGMYTARLVIVEKMRELLGNDGYSGVSIMLCALGDIKSETILLCYFKLPSLGTLFCFARIKSG